jgi:stage V sporulation protein AF
MEKLTACYLDNVERLNALLGVGRCCDMVSRDFVIAGRKARIWVVDGYGSDAVLERMGAFWLSLTPETVGELSDMQDFADRFITFSETNVTDDLSDILTSVFLGKTLLVMEGASGGALMDAKGYPGRSVDEPANGKVLRGAHDGFLEAVVPNMALIRRRIRDPHLTMEAHKVGARSHSDIVLCYLDDKADPKLLRDIRERLQSVTANSLTQGQESLVEAISPRQWYNPFPTARYTERPDAAAACVMEGSVILLVDNSPAAVILPTSFFDFVQEANDFSFPPIVGTYLRLLRMLVLLLSLLITPFWYLMVKEPGRLPDYLSFLAQPEPCALSLLWQLLVVELLIDLLKIASLNTPSTLSNSFSMLGALILGNFAVQAKWLSPEVLVYMAFVSIAGFAQPSYELGYAFKLLRVLLLLLVRFFDWAGLIGGLAGILVLLILTKPIAGRGYLYPVIPFNGKALRRLLIREPVSRDNS